MSDTSDRLANVVQRETWVVCLWPQRDDPNDSPPLEIVGPFTKVECERIEANLACKHRRKKITTRLPEWA